MHDRFRTSLLFALGLVIGVSLTLGHGVFATRDGDINSVPLEDLRTFTDVLARIKSDYVEEISDTKLLEDAVRGMLAGLDPHSAYLNEEEFKELQIGTTGEFGGLGIEVGMEDGFVKVIAPIDDTPAERAGIKAGDLIIRLDERPVKGLTLNEAVKLMRGKPGSEIVLTVVREGEDKPLKIAIERDVIRVKSVKSRILEDGYGYVRITNFQSKTTSDLISAIERLKKESGGLSGLILDLRNNPGGVLNGAVGVSNAFLEEGLIVYTEGRVEDSKLKYSATPGDVIDGTPLVVLVNGGSASASEIVAGAMQDHGRGIIMGTRTFGKGSVQTIQELNNGGAVKLTTARYYTPNGRSIQAEGIAPDIVLETVKIASLEKDASERVKEADLSGHLDNGNHGSGKEAPVDAQGKVIADDDLARSDYQLYEALNLLKGLTIMRAKAG
jgi:carboxyl-terminal processing protease